MAKVTNLVQNKLHPITGEDLKPTIVTTWRDGTTPMSDSLCGGLYNKDTNTSSVTFGSYFKWNFSGPYPLSRLVVVNEVNFKKLINDFGSTNQVLIIDKIIPITVNYTIPANISLFFVNGSGFDISATRTLTILGSINNPNFRIFRGTGNVIMTNVPNQSPAWWWDSSNVESGYALNACAVCAGASNQNMILPGRIWQTSTTFTPPDNLKISGMGWRKSTIRATAPITTVILKSSNVFEDIQLQGQSIGLIGISIPGIVNRVNINRVRIESFLDKGFYCESLQNSLMTDMFVQLCKYCYYVGVNGAENCTWLNCNGNLDNSDVDQRSIYINTIRNSRFIGGIFERGVEDYQVEINGGTVSFESCEIQGGTLANVYVNNAVVNFDKVSFALPLPPQYGIITSTTGKAILTNCAHSGNESRSLVDRYSGNVIVAATNMSKVINDEKYWDTSQAPWIASSGGTSVFDPVKKCYAMTGNSAARGATKSLGTAAYIPAGTIGLIKFTLKNVTGGDIKFETLGASGFARTIGNYGNGTWTIPYIFQGDTYNYYKFSAGEAIAKSWELYEFSFEIVNGVASTIEELNITNVYNKTASDARYNRFLKGTVSGDSSTLVWNIPHGLGSIPTNIGIPSPRNLATGNAGIKFVDADITNIIITTNSALTTGTNNGVWDIPYQK